MSRAAPAQRPPDPDLDWRRFPVSTVRATTPLFRAARHGRSPWWFCGCGDCRFDLQDDRGTCYAGTDPVTGLLETIGPDWAAGGTVSTAFLRQRTVHTLELTAPVKLANLASGRAVEFRVTNELSTMTPYDVPQAYARTLDATRASSRHAFDGIRSRTRFDTRPGARGVALFGPAGVHGERASVEREVDEALLGALRALGVAVAEPPTLRDLVVAEDVG